MKAQDNYDSLDLSLLWESGYGLKKKDIVTPLSPTVLSVECVLCLQFQGISWNPKPLIANYSELFEIWGYLLSLNLLLYTPLQNN